MTAADLRRAVRDLADPATAAFLQRYFKTGAGEYGEGDRFLGIRVPSLRRLAREYRSLPLADALALLESLWHEERLLALLILVEQFRRGSLVEREAIYLAYLAHTRHINNWDLVDTSAEHIVGAHLDPADLTVLKRLARSASVWERRIAIMSTFHLTRAGILAPALEIAALLLHDGHDLIHKAVGWMLREAGKRDRARLEEFLGEHYRAMPRTMLRYALEHIPEPRRGEYMRGEV